jgi:GNAT superfamily N-acetyltransferase
MTRAELDMAVDWAAAEGWNPGLSDAEAFWAADPGGFWIALLDGEPVACISVVRHSQDFGFLGFYICRPAYRGQGHGHALWRAAIAHLGERCIGLDGVPAQQENYRKSGFTWQRRNIRFEAAAPRAPAAPPGIAIEDAATLPFDAIAAYDRTCFEAPREAFLRLWLTLPGHVALATRTAGRLSGYGVIRPARQGAKIGPLFADGPEEAQALFAALLARAPAGPVQFDVAEPNAASVALAREAGMQPVFETARMYRGTPPPVRPERIFGVTTFELG